MSTKRTTVSRPPRAKITPEAVDLFRQGLELQAAGGLTSWNEDAYFELQTKLDMALGRMKPWQVNQLDADPNSPPHIFRAELAAGRMAKCVFARLFSRRNHANGG